MDVVALLDRYPADALLDLAAAKDRGFTPGSFRVSLGSVLRIVPARWKAAGFSPERAEHVREMILAWRARLAA